MIQAIFFDFNGVIVDDERIHLNAYREVLATENITLSDAEYFECLGMDDVAFVQAAFGRAGRPLNDIATRDVIKRAHGLHREFIEQELPIPSGVVTFVKAAARYFSLGIVSMAVRAEIEHVLDLAGLNGYFAVVVSAEPQLKYKPAPDCYRRGLELLNEARLKEGQRPLAADECLAIEDSPPGILAARAAGMRTIGVTNTVGEVELRAAGAEIVTRSLADWTVAAVQLIFDR